MAEVLSLQGREVFSWARACVKGVVVKLAGEKGVLLDDAQRDWLTGDILQRLDFPLVHGVATVQEEALLAMGREVNTGLDALVLARMWHLVAMFEGKTDVEDPAVRAAADLIMDRHIATLPKQGGARWPDPMQLVADHYARVPRGPITVTPEDGSELTTYWLGRKLHRDPKDGPALQWVHGEKRGAEYRMNGELHRPHEDGPAMIYSPFRNVDLSGEEYFEHGKRHRPSHLGPAVRHWDETGRPMAEVYYENGELHRDPAQGPALWGVRDKRTDPKAERPCTEIKYCTRGKLHRDQEDGPALIVRDNQTGVMVKEQYWRNGKWHRVGGPARVLRDETGKVCREEWYVDGILHRDPRQGPAQRRVHDGPNCYGERPFTETGYWVNGQLHRDEKEGAALIVRDDETGVVLEEQYCREGALHREGGPAVVGRSGRGTLVSESWHRNGQPRGSQEGPWILWYDEEGRLASEEWCGADGEARDASEGPAYIGYDRHMGRISERYYVNDELRLASLGPAEITRDWRGNILWEEFWDGQNMIVKRHEPMTAEAGSDG